MKLNPSFMNHFSTPDIGLASALITKQVPLEYMEREYRSDRVYFYFDRDKHPLVDEIVQAYWNQSLPLDAQNLLTQHKNLKRRLFEEAK